MDILEEVAAKAGITIDEAMRASEALLEQLHKSLVEYREGDFFGKQAYWQLTERGFFHLLGFVEQFSCRYSWDKGTISEYLGRSPPVDRWKALSREIQNWNWADQ